MGDKPPHGMGAGDISEHGVPSDHGKATATDPGRNLGLTSLGRSDTGGGAG